MATKKSKKTTDPRRALASVAAILEYPAILERLEHHPRVLVLEAIHQALEWFRAELRPGDTPPDREATGAKVLHFLELNERERLRPVVNATGTILHTNLGRALLPREAIEALAGLYRCCNLQIDLGDGTRGKRNYMSQELICRLTGAEAATIANNNAGATMLLLAALCRGREVVISRGQLIEIGGSYRLPDCIHASGAVMVEVGTTNRTHLRDYENAINENTGALMRCNTSNYRMEGFTKEVPIGEIASLKEKHPDLIVIDDLGCGALVDLEQFGLPHEATVQESIAGGADIVCFSGDKLISGPQAGIIVGRADLIARIKDHPLSRMMRVDKLTDLALEKTLRLFLEPETLVEKNPTLATLAKKGPELKRRAQGLKRRLARLDPPAELRVTESESAMGGGSLPGVPIPTFVLAIRPRTHTAARLHEELRRVEPPVIARVSKEEVHLDMRTLIPGDDELIFRGLAEIWREA